MQLDTYGQQTQVLSQSANRVLRNTYMLLALTMVPTVAGALLGVQMQFSFLAGSPFIAFMLFLGISFAFFWGIERNKNSGLGVALLLGFTFFMGLMLSRILQVALGFSNGGSMIALAAGGTGAIFATMAGIASVSKRDFTNMGKFLTVGLVVGATRSHGLDLSALNGPILSPGLGAQGATAADIPEVFSGADTCWLLPASSRGLLGKGPDVAALRAACESVRDDIEAALRPAD